MYKIEYQSECQGNLTISFVIPLMVQTYSAGQAGVTWEGKMENSEDGGEQLLDCKPMTSCVSLQEPSSMLSLSVKDRMYTFILEERMSFPKSMSPNC